jgi:predicted tellurium resistance membrane protein TerC
MNRWDRLTAWGKRHPYLDILASTILVVLGVSFLIHHVVWWGQVVTVGGLVALSALLAYSNPSRNRAR